MFLRSEPVFEGAGGSAALTFGRALPPVVAPTVADRLREQFEGLDLVPDLGVDIGSRTWWRGAATCAALITATCFLSPGFDRPLRAMSPAPLEGSDWDEARAQGIAPLAYGATTGHRLGASSAVVPLPDTPERPILELTATLANGEALDRTLARAGVGRGEAARIADLVAAKVDLGQLRPGTQFALTLGRRPTKDIERPLERLAFRARFDLAMEVSRETGTLAATAIPIAIDRTPLRIEGRVGPSLYRSARAAGVPAKAVEAFLRSVASRTSVGGLDPDDRFDIIVEQAKAATGEVQLGNLLYAGLKGSKSLQLMRWEDEGKTSWFDPSGTGDRRSGAAQMPVAGRLTSGFGARVHPVLRTVRMHKGLDLAAPMGAPIRAAMDGVVAMAGRAGGYGNFVKLSHSGGMATGYGHMSRIAVRSGTRVGRGDIIGYVGSTGMSTGPHLHYELWKNGVPINPGKVTFESVQRLQGGALAAFKAKLAKLLSVRASD